MMGYIVKYKKKINIFFHEKSDNNFTEMRQALIQQKKLVEMLKRPLSYIVLSAYLVEMEQYKLSHPEERFEELKIM